MNIKRLRNQNLGQHAETSSSGVLSMWVLDTESMKHSGETTAQRLNYNQRSPHGNLLQTNGDRANL